MLPEKPWKLDAIVRLALSVLACFFAGSVLATALHQAHHKTGSTWQFLLSSSLALSAFGLTVASLLKPWSLEKLLPRMILSLVCLYAGMACAMWAETAAGRPPESVSIGQMAIRLAGFHGAALLLIHHFLKEQDLSWTETFGFSNRWPLALLWGLMIGALFFEIGHLLLRISAELMTRLPVPVKPEEQQAVQTLRLATSWRERVVLGAGTILLVPLAEETLFRGILYPAIKRAGFPKLAVWVTSLLFAIIHMNIATFAPLLALALVLTFLYEHTGNLLAPVTAHAVFNGVNFAVLYLQQTRP